MSVSTETSPGDAFGASRARFDTIVEALAGDAAACQTHAELEVSIGTQGRKLLRQLFQDHVDLRAERELRVEAVVDCDGVCHSSVESAHDRPLTCVFGEVRIGRGCQGLCV